MHELKIFFGDNVLKLSDNIEQYGSKSKDIYLYHKNFNFIDLIDTMQFDGDKKEITVVAKNRKLLFKKISENFKKVEAAGGIVFNEFGELLVISRLGKLDLPKGHIEKNEKPHRAAVREVEEECGVRNLIIEEKLAKTYHVYTLDNSLILKITQWYILRCKKQQTCPQIDENIVEAYWLPMTQISSLLTNTYASISDLLQKVIENDAQNTDI